MNRTNTEIYIRFGDLVISECSDKTAYPGSLSKTFPGKSKVYIQVDAGSDHSISRQFSSNRTCPLQVQMVNICFQTMPRMSLQSHRIVYYLTFRLL